MYTPSMLLYNESTSQYSHQTEKQVKAVEILNTNHAINTAIEKRKRKRKRKILVPEFDV